MLRSFTFKVWEGRLEFVEGQRVRISKRWIIHATSLDVDVKWIKRRRTRWSFSNSDERDPKTAEEKKTLGVGVIYSL